MTANFTYLDCQKCNERIHCDDCEARLTEVLLRITGIQSADIQMARKHLSVNTEMEADKMEEILPDNPLSKESRLWGMVLLFL